MNLAEQSHHRRPGLCACEQSGCIRGQIVCPLFVAHRDDVMPIVDDTNAVFVVSEAATPTGGL